MLLISVYIAVSVELLHLKPNCSFTNMLFESFIYNLLKNFGKRQAVMKWACNWQ